MIEKTEKRAYAVVRVADWPIGWMLMCEHADGLKDAGFQPGDEVEIRTREEASLDVTCPWCGSTPGVACTGVINDGKAHEARRRSHDRASQSNPEKPSEIRLRVAQGEEQDDSPLLVNEMMGLLADSMEHTMELAMQHGYDLDDVKSFRLLTRVNEMKERLEKNRKRLLGEDCTCSGRARHFPTGIVHIDSCPRSVVGLLRAQAAALAAAPEEQEAPPPFVTGLDFDGNPLVVCENEFHYRDPHKKGRACIRPHPAARQEAPRGWAFDGAHSGGSATHATDTTTPAALPEEVVCDRYSTPHRQDSHVDHHGVECTNPRPAHPPAARTEQEKQLGKEGNCCICGKPRPDCRRESLAAGRIKSAAAPMVFCSWVDGHGYQPHRQSDNRIDPEPAPGKCGCHLEAGDSECMVHGADECGACGAKWMGLDPAWRWNGKGWEHKCPGLPAQAGHFAAAPHARSATPEPEKLGEGPIAKAERRGCKIGGEP